MTQDDSLKANAAAVIIAVLALGAAVVMTNRSDAASAAEDTAKYCAMTTMYKYDTLRGVPPSQRRGWPEYKGAAVCTR